MINRYILLITLLYAFQLCAQNNHFRINGRVDTRYNDSLVTLFTFTGDIIRSADSTYVQNGHFDFTASCLLGVPRVAGDGYVKGEGMGGRASALRLTSHCANLHTAVLKKMAHLRHL